MKPRWKPSLISWSIVVLIFGSSLIALYPMTAQWFSARNQAKVLIDSACEHERALPDQIDDLDAAREYNDELIAGETQMAGTRSPGRDGGTGPHSEYAELLSSEAGQPMARIRYDKANIDLPVFHGTGESALLQGAGHLEGTHLPVGGVGTRAVITAHRGLPNATMFTDLDKATEGDTFTIEVVGQTLTYRVSDVEVVAPENTESIRRVPGKDLVTLVTCTPVGVNSHRIIVTGERITPTAHEDQSAPSADLQLPGFPLWAVLVTLSLLANALLIFWFGKQDARLKQRSR